jgi:predicted transcriptional regulator
MGPSYKKNIQRIIQTEPNWFVDKDVSEVANKLTTQYGIPGAKESQVSVTLTRLFKQGVLSRKEEKGKFLYSIANSKTSA